ncbi:MAG: hypothetical protein FJ014_16495 [Chloroflexi bacterium]|nr:hypothetical protein [Chloroflexota bacterium]
MTRLTFDAAYWTHDFAVTEGDVNRLYAYLRGSGRPEKAMNLLAQVVRHKLEQSSLELDTQQRHKSEAAAQKLLKDQQVRVYHQTDDYQLGERLLIAWRGSRPDDWQYDVGEVFEKKAANEPHYCWTIRLRFADGTERSYVAGADLAHPMALELRWQLFGIRVKEERSTEQGVNEVLRVYGATLLPHLLGRLDEDDHFVRWADLCWLAEALPSLSRFKNSGGA